MIYWIAAAAPQRLAIMPRPGAGDRLQAEIDAWRAEGVQTVISLLEDHEVAELGLEGEGAACHRAGIDLRRFPIPDGGAPRSTAAALDLAREALVSLDGGDAIAIHCHAGIGRSSLMAALFLAGLEADAALAAISEARGLTVPETDEQRAWLSGLDLGGTSR